MHFASGGARMAGGLSPAELRFRDSRRSSTRGWSTTRRDVLKRAAGRSERQSRRKSGSDETVFVVFAYPILKADYRSEILERGIVVRAIVALTVAPGSDLTTRTDCLQEKMLNLVIRKERGDFCRCPRLRRCPRPGSRLALRAPPRGPFWYDGWHLRWRWTDLKSSFWQVLDGSFRLGPARTVRTDDGSV